MYDVKGQQITMTGQTVTLTQKGNTIVGKKLVVFLDSGRAIMDPIENNATGEKPTRIKARLQKDVCRRLTN